MRVDAVLLAAGAAIAGGIGAVYPLPALICGLVGLIALGAELSARARLLIVLVFAVGATRGGLEVRAFERARINERDAIGPPSRCDVDAVVESSPVWSDGTA